jgi:hypothetical protein
MLERRTPPARHASPRPTRGGGPRPVAQVLAEWWHGPGRLAAALDPARGAVSVGPGRSAEGTSDSGMSGVQRPGGATPGLVWRDNPQAMGLERLTT